MLKKLKTLSLSRNAATPLTISATSSPDARQRSLTLTKLEANYCTGSKEVGVKFSKENYEDFANKTYFVQSSDINQTTKEFVPTLHRNGKAHACTLTYHVNQSDTLISNVSAPIIDGNGRCHYYSRKDRNYNKVSLIPSTPVQNGKIEYQESDLSQTTNLNNLVPPLPPRRYTSSQTRKRSATLPMQNSDEANLVIPRTSDFRYITNPPLPPRPKENFKSLITKQSFTEDRTNSHLINPLDHLDEGKIMQNIRDLVRHGWYWGPMNKEEAEDKLACTNDGTFLVRDSSDDRHLLTISFRTSSKTFHTRIEFWKGKFSVFPNCMDDCYDSVGQLIDHAMNHCKNGVFFYR